MDRIADYQAFVAVVEKGSLTGAAGQLGRSLQSVSRSLAAVERGLGVELIRRTTRRCAPTDAGLALYRRLSAALSEIDAANQETANRQWEASGLLRITSSTAFAPLYIVPAAGAFLAAHPKVGIELGVSDHYVDLVSEGFDLAVRIGELPDSSLKAKRLANDGQAPSVTVSVGVALYPTDGMTIEKLFAAADRGLYRMKRREERQFRLGNVAACL